MKDRKLLAIFASQRPNEPMNADVIKNLNADVINNLNADVIKNLNADVINNLNADVINNLNADVIKNLNADVIKNLNADVIKNLNADVIKNLNAKARAMLKEYNADLASIPVIEKPYSKLLEDIQAKKRTHDQSSFGPENCPEEKNICGTQMCTAGHLVNMANAYEIKQKYGWEKAASMVHQRSTSAHLPEQNYGSIPQEWAMAFIEENASRENEVAGNV